VPPGHRPTRGRGAPDCPVPQRPFGACHGRRLCLRRTDRSRAGQDWRRACPTAPSLDAGEANAFASVKRLRIDESEPQVIADWLSPSAVVLLSQGRVYAQDRSGLWRLGSQRKDQRRLFSAPVGVRAVSAIGDQEFLVMRQQGRSAVAARPLTWWARTRAAVSF